MTGSGRIARWADNKVYLPLARFAERHARIKLWFGLAGAVGGAFAFAALERVLNNLGTDWGTFEVHPEVMVKAAGVGLIGGGATALNYTRRFINRVELALKRDADQKNKKFVEENARLNGIIMKLTTEQRTIMGQTPQAQKPVGALLGGRYELVEKLGEGGMAFTYKIRDTKMTNRLIVYKVPRPDVFQFPKERERFEKAEAEAMEQLHHPGIVRFIGLEDMSHEDYKKLTGISLEGWPNIPSQIPYIVMEYISAPTLDRELSLYELAIMTRAGQAKALGLKDKGHLGVGADADIAIYNVNPETTDIARKYKPVRRAFGNAAYTIKDGKVVVKDGEVVQHVDGRTMWLDVKTAEPVKIDDEMKRKFKEYWTVEYDNYPVMDHYIKVPDPITIKADV